MIHLRRALALGLVAALPLAASAQARTATPNGVAFVVIGPDSQTMRAWTARWIREVVERDAPRHADRLFAHDSLILSMLDTDDLPPSPPPPGPSAESWGFAVWPHDLRTPIVLSDLQHIMRAARVWSIAQIIIEPTPSGFRLTAQLLHANDPGVSVHLTVSDRILRAAAVRIAHELIAEWDLDSQGPALALANGSW